MFPLRRRIAWSFYSWLLLAPLLRAKPAPPRPKLVPAGSEPADTYQDAIKKAIKTADEYAEDGKTDDAIHILSGIVRHSTEAAFRLVLLHERNADYDLAIGVLDDYVLKDFNKANSDDADAGTGTEEPGPHPNQRSVDEQDFPPGAPPATPSAPGEDAEDPIPDEDEEDHSEDDRPWTPRRLRDDAIPPGHDRRGQDAQQLAAALSDKGVFLERLGRLDEAVAAYVHATRMTGCVGLGTLLGPSATDVPKIS